MALEVVRLAQVLSQAMPGYLADQLRRAASSIVLNIAEGSARTGSRDRLRFFTTASASARAVTAIADVAEALALAEASALVALRDRCDHVAAMLHRFR